MLVLSLPYLEGRSTLHLLPAYLPQSRRLNTVWAVPALVQAPLAPWKQLWCISALAFLMIPLTSGNHFLSLIPRTH